MINKTIENPTDCGPPAPVARRILVVDDDEALNHLAQLALHRGGFETQGVLTGAEAIARVIADPGLILLLDHKLPDMDGTDLMRTLIEQGRRVPFVAMTGHGNEQIAVEMMKLGAKEYLPKAFNITEILPEVFHRVFRELETERRLALTEQALAEAEARYRSIFENAGEGIFQTGLDGTVMVVNPALARLYGYDTPEQFMTELPKVAPVYVDIRDREHFLAELLNNGRVEHLEVQMRRRDGSIVWSSLNARLIRDKEGNPLHVSGSVQDISERKRIEAALTKSEAVLLKAQEIAHLGHWELDLVANRLTWSDETYRIFGLSPQEFGATYEAFLDFVHPDDRAAVDAAYSRSVRERLDGYEIEHRILRKNDDAVRHVQERCEHVRDSTGTVVQSVGTVLDITERKRAEAALKENIFFLESLERLEWAIRKVPDMERMMSDALDVVLEVMEVDRAWLVYPLDPDTEFWSAPMERTRPEWPGALALGVNVPLSPELREQWKRFLALEGPVAACPGGDLAVEQGIRESFAVQSYLAMMLRPKIDKPWQFGVHQCTHERVWTGQEKALFKAMGGRISDALNSLLYLRNLRESEERFRALVEQAQDAIFVHDLTGRMLLVNQRACEVLGYSREELSSMSVADVDPEFQLRNDPETIWNSLPQTFESRHRRKDGGLFPVEVRLCRIAYGDRQVLLAAVRDITERKRAEEALAASEEKFRNVADYTYDWEYWLSPEGSLVWVSPSCELFTGYRAEEFMADPDLLRRVMHPEDKDLFDKHLHDIETGSIESCDMDFRILHSSGQTVWLNHFCVDIARADGTPLGRRASNRDITARKQAEDKLTKELALSTATSGLSEALIAKASTLQDIADITLHYSKLLTDSEHGFVSVIDPKNGDLVSYTLTQMMGEQCRVEEGQARITFPANPDGSYSKLWGHALNLQNPFYTNSPASHPASSGTPAGHIPLENFLAVPALIGDKLIGLIALANSPDEYTDRDLVVVKRLADLYAVAIDRQATVTALWTSEQQIRGLFNATTDSVMLLDQAATILAINEGGAKRRGLEARDVVGKALEVFLAPDLAARRREGMEESARAKHWVDIEETHDDGRFYHVRLFPILDDAGNAAQFASFSRDVTEGVLAENALREALAQAKELAGKAEAANKAKSEFLANMSHEIRTPLNGILGMLQVLQCTPLHEDQNDFLINAIKSSNRLNRLLSDILDISVIEAGKIAIRRAAFSITETCQSVQDLFAQEAAEKRLTLHFSIDDRLPSELIGDEGRLRQILFNLVGNALKFTSLGGVEMDICLVSPPGELPCRVLFSVTDTGIGIPDNMISDIFEPFTQVEGSFIRRYQGAGLGLAIVRRLTRLMGGEICIASEEGVGTSMYVVFSFGAQTQSRTGLVSTASAEPMPDGGRKRILLVEDDEINQLTMKCLLEMGGHAVTTAGNGKQALEWLRQDDFELIIMDVQMPVMDGIEATRIIRGSPEFKAKSGIPIIAVTAYAMIGDRENFLAAGMNDYIPKPVDQDALLEMIKRLTAHR